MASSNALAERLEFIKRTPAAQPDAAAAQKWEEF